MSVADDTTPIVAAPVAGAAVLARTDGAAAGFGDAVVVSGVSLEVRAGETVAIVGRSGCGKTTLLHLLAGLLPPSAGTVVAEPAALMPQRDGLMPWASARTNAALPLRIAGVPRKEARLLATGQLEALGLGGAARQPVATRSPAPCSPGAASCCSTNPSPPSTP